MAFAAGLALVIGLSWLRQAHAEPKCGIFSERQADIAEGHLTRYRDTCEHVVCYTLSHRYERLGNNSTSGIVDNTLSCVREAQ